MKRMLTVAGSAALYLLAGSGAAIAQDDDEMPWLPVEAISCKYNEGKGPADLDAVNAEWNKWMDNNGYDNYFGATLVPHYHADYASVDVIWLGVWKDGHAMGTGTDAWINDGGDLGQKYTEVLNCSSGSQYISGQLRAPQPNDDDEDDNTFVLRASNCSFNGEGDGVFEAFMAANAEWNAYAEANDIPGAAWIWFPLHGDDDDSYDFKIIGGYDDHTMRGAAFQKYAEGHWLKSSELFEPLIDCDISRLYNGKVVRSMAMEE